VRKRSENEREEERGSSKHQVGLLMRRKKLERRLSYLNRLQRERRKKGLRTQRLIAKSQNQLHLTRMRVNSTSDKTSRNSPQVRLQVRWGETTQMISISVGNRLDRKKKAERKMSLISISEGKELSRRKRSQPHRVET
jgi:hypothetical protein